MTITRADHPWRLRSDAPTSTAPESTEGLAVDIDPRAPSVTLGVRILTGGASDVRSGAVYRGFIEGVDADWSEALAWLAGAEAAALMAAVSAGYTAEMLWSGDWYVRWTSEGVDACEALRDGVAARTSPAAGGPPPAPPGG